MRCDLPKMQHFWCLMIVVAVWVDGSPSARSGHQRHVPDNDAITFPGEYERRTMNANANANANTPPLSNVTLGFKSSYTPPPVDFIQKISNYNVSDLLLYYVDDYEDDALLANRFGEDIERSQAVQPKPAPCIPEMQTVKLVPDKADPSIIYIPACTRMERCGGCCQHNLLSCQAKESELVSFKVIKTQFAAGNRLKYIGKDIVHMEKHTKCHCGCKVKASDCTQLQKYNEAECKCQCSNTDEEQKCHANSGKKLWDYTTCSCQCRNTSHCSTGFMFDAINCRCIPLPKRRHVLDPQPQPASEQAKQNPDQFVFQQQQVDDYDY